MDEHDFCMNLRALMNEGLRNGVNVLYVLKKEMHKSNMTEWVAAGKNIELFKWFEDAETKIGLKVESVLSSNGGGVCCKPKGGKSKSFDLILSEDLVGAYGLVGNRLEIKVSRATHKREEEYWRRAKMRSEGRFAGTFQQVKKSEADYGLFFVIYADVVDVYWMPYSFIGNRVKLHKQHLGHLTEGQVGISDTFHECCYIGSLNSFSELNLFNFRLGR